VSGLAVAAAAVNLVGWPSLVWWWWHGHRSPHRQRWWCPYCWGWTESTMARDRFDAHLELHRRAEATLARTQRLHRRQ